MKITDIYEQDNITCESDTGWRLKVNGRWRTLHSACTHYWITMIGKRVPVDKTELIRAQVEYCDRLKTQQGAA